MDNENTEEKNINFYIFSDESGNILYEKDCFYVQSWFMVSEKNYHILKERVEMFKEINDIGELKFNKNTEYDFLEGVDLKVFFTVTSFEYFKNRHFKVLENIDVLDQPETSSDLFSINKGQFNFKNKIITNIKKIIFLYLFEYYHLENFINDFVPSDKKIRVIKDTPQYVDKLYKEVFKKVRDSSSKNLKNLSLSLIKKSEKFIGIELSDIMAGAFRHSLVNKEKHNIFDKIDFTYSIIFNDDTKTQTNIKKIFSII